MFFFHRAFRPFFIGGSLFAVASMLFWGMQTSGFSQATYNGMIWHGHEMIFGYALATVTGFLMTAVMNWTGKNSASGKPLVFLFLVWLCARLAILLGMPLFWVAGFDLVFSLGLFLMFVTPIWQAKQWKQAGLAAKFFLLLIANGLFYAGAFGWLADGQNWGMILGLFLVLAINLTMMRRVLPFFTEKALGLTSLRQSTWLDRFAIGGFLLLMLLVTFWPSPEILVVVGFGLLVVHGIRWVWWYHPKIWQQLLIWPLFVSYGFMILGMGLFGFVGLGWVGTSLAIHALAAGGIGLLCSAMMARISLGHTGRNVFDPPKGLVWVFRFLLLGAMLRVMLPLLDASHYAWWVLGSQLAWIAGFAFLSGLYWKILLQPNPEQDSGIRL